MTRRWLRMAAPLVMSVALAVSPVRLGAQATPAPRGPTAEAVDAAVAKGIAWIYSQEQPDGSFPPYLTHTGQPFFGGSDVMAVAALAYAGEPLSKPEMGRALKHLMELDLKATYTVGFRIVVLAELWRQSDNEDERTSLRNAIKRDAALLAGFQLGNGAWSYGKKPDDSAWDFSNTQIAVLGLQQAVSCGIELNPILFQKAQDFYLKMVLKDGGWNYNDIGPNARTPSYGSMTAAAVANLFLTRSILYPGLGCPCRGGRSSGRRNAALDLAIDRGTKWLGDNFSASEIPNKTAGVATTPYWYYAAERVGIASGYKYLGKYDWYRSIAGAILYRQQADGSWPRSLPDTAFCLLFLIKGRGPILMNKLMFDGQWNPHPQDLENLVEYVGRVKEQRILWQIIHLGVPVEEMHDAPILYISAESAPNLTDEERAKLRRFTDTGGTILFEAACGNHAADAWLKKTCQELWPDWELKTVDKEHPLWTADAQLAGRLPVLEGMSDGLRTFLFYAPRDISCGWSTQAVAQGRTVFDLGVNLYAYATDRGKLRARLAGRQETSAYASQAVTKGGRASFAVARVKHGGDWYLGRNYEPWTILAAALKQRAGLEVREADPLAPGDAAPPEVALLYLGGRAGCDLGASGGKWLGDFVARGGRLFAEAMLGDERFDEPVRAALTQAGFTLKALPAGSPLVSGQFAGDAKGYDASRVSYTPALQPQRIGQPGPLLVGIYSGETLVGVYSPFDILFAQTGCKAFGSRGYAADDARALTANLLLWVSEK